MELITANTLPPMILQIFNQMLLDNPAKFRDDTEVLWGIYEYIRDKLIPKAEYNPRWLEKVKEKERVFLELYERTKIKEKETEGDRDIEAQRPFYYFGDPDRPYGRLSGRLKYKAGRYSHKKRPNEI